MLRTEPANSPVMLALIDLVEFELARAEPFSQEKSWKITKRRSQRFDGEYKEAYSEATVNNADFLGPYFPGCGNIGGIGCPRTEAYFDKCREVLADLRQINTEKNESGFDFYRLEGEERDRERLRYTSDIDRAAQQSERSYQLVREEDRDNPRHFKKLDLPSYKQWEFREKGVVVRLVHYGHRFLSVGRRNFQTVFPKDDIIVGEIDFVLENHYPWSQRLMEGLDGLGFFFCALDQRSEEGEIVPKLLVTTVGNFDDRYRPRAFERSLNYLGFVDYFISPDQRKSGYSVGMIATVENARKRYDDLRTRINKRRGGKKELVSRLFHRGLREYERSGRSYWEDHRIK